MYRFNVVRELVSKDPGALGNSFVRIDGGIDLVFSKHRCYHRAHCRNTAGGREVSE